jgi:hypothetical protein
MVEEDRPRVVLGVLRDAMLTAASALQEWRQRLGRKGKLSFTGPSRISHFETPYAKNAHCAE